MNLVYGEVIALFCEDGMRMGTIRVGGALQKAALDLLPEAAPGTRVLLCDGLAIGTVVATTKRASKAASRKSTSHVPRDSR